MVLPNKDEMMRRKELQEGDLLRYLPASMPELVKNSRVSNQTVLNMLISLRKRGIVEFRGGEWRVRGSLR
jgi:DNA-binding IclR family transcriptional regulator